MNNNYEKNKLFTSVLIMISAFLTASGALLKRKTKLLFLLCFFMPSVVFSYEFPPERSESDAENEIGLKALEPGFLLLPQFQISSKKPTS